MPNVTASYGKSLDIIAFFRVLSYIIDDLSCLNSCISTKNSHILCQTCHTFWYSKMINVTAGYGRLSDLMNFWEFSYITCFKHLTLSNFYKLSAKTEEQE